MGVCVWVGRQNYVISQALGCYSSKFGKLLLTSTSSCLVKNIQRGDAIGRAKASEPMEIIGTIIYSAFLAQRQQSRRIERIVSKKPVLIVLLWIAQLFLQTGWNAFNQELVTSSLGRLVCLESLNTCFCSVTYSFWAMLSTGLLVVKTQQSTWIFFWVVQ